MTRGARNNTHHSADAAQFNDQLNAFLKNLAILGGLLLVFQRGIEAKR